MKLHFSSESWKIIAVVAFYWIISITTVFINKLLFTRDVVQLDAFFFITWFQCFFSALYYYIYDIISGTRARKSPTSLSILKSVFPLSVVFSSMIIFNNLCLKYVNISFYYLGRSLTTVFNVLLTYAILHQRTSLKTCACCALIIFGFWLGIDQEQFIGTFSISGTFFGIVASLSVALYSIKVKEVLLSVDSIIWLLSYYNNIYSCVIFSPFILFSGELSVLQSHEGWTDLRLWSLLIASGFCGLAIGYATALQIKVTSPLTHNISGTAKACAQTILASYYFKETRPWLWWISNWIVLVGSALYTKVKQEEMKKREFQLLK